MPRPARPNRRALHEHRGLLGRGHRRQARQARALPALGSDDFAEGLHALTGHEVRQGARLVPWQAGRGLEAFERASHSIKCA